MMIYKWLKPIEAMSKKNLTETKGDNLSYVIDKHILLLISPLLPPIIYKLIVSHPGDAFGFMVIVAKNGPGAPSANLDEAVCFL